MSRRILLAFGAFVIWTAITVIVGRLRSGGEAEFVEGVTHGFNWTYLLAAAFLRHPSAHRLPLARLPSPAKGLIQNRGNK